MQGFLRLRIVASRIIGEDTGIVAPKTAENLVQLMRTDYTVRFSGRLCFIQVDNTRSDS